jgi:glycosyltransferase involved in cell wall biosynthesis
MQVVRPMFTVATITYNSVKYVRQAIESVLASSFENFEFIISDDYSTDGTWDLVQEFSDPRIRMWRNERNLGEYPNRNKVLREAKGRFIIFIDGDDILYKEALARLAGYLDAFPSAKGVWGVYPVYFDFFVMPYLFSREQLTRLIFLSNYPITVVGFAETVFSVEALLEIGGFDERFAIGDTYIKRKFALYHSVLLTTAGFAFWRQYPDQASNRVRSFNKQLIETYRIDRELLWSEELSLDTDELKQARRNFHIRSIKLLVMNTLLRGKFYEFFRLMKLLDISYTHLCYLLHKGDYSYKAGAEVGNPLMNEYHFKYKK